MADAPSKTRLADYESMAERISHVPQIIGLLRRIKDARSLLRIRIPGSERSFTSMLLDINTEKGYILLDEINSAGGHELAREVGKVRVFSQHDGVDMNFSCNIRVVQNRKGLTFYQAPLPEYISYMQRRSEFRVHITLDQHLQLILPLNPDATLDGELCDLSFGGVGARLETDMELKQGLVIPDCKIQIPDEEPIQTSLEIRFVREENNGQQTRIGGRFVNLTPELRTHLRKTVTRLQREMLRRKTRD